MVKTILEKITIEKNVVLDQNSNYLVTYIHPYAYPLLKRRIEVLKSFNYITFDGSAMIMLFNLFGIKKVNRLAPDFSSYFYELFKNASEMKETIFFIGTETDKLNLAINNFNQQFKNLNIIGFHSGFFNEFEKRNLISQIIELAPKIVIVGMGAVKQEDFLIELTNKGWKGRGYTCGGFLHQSAERQLYYPNWVIKLNIRWIYRIFTEPKLVKRYFIDYPYNMFLISIDIIHYKYFNSYK